MKPVNFSLWGIFKDKRYADKPEVFNALNDNIRDPIGEIKLYTIDKNILMAEATEAAIGIKFFIIINRRD